MSRTKRRSLTARQERWRLRKPFVISRGSITVQDVVVVEVQEGEFRGRGEAAPSPRFGETVDSVLDTIANLRPALEAADGREDINRLLPKGAARCAVDCAFWDLECKRKGLRAWELIGLTQVGPRESSYTLSLDRPDAMAAAAREVDDYNIIKLKLGSGEDLARVRAVREAVPDKRLIVDANEAWSFDELRQLVGPLHDLGVELIEQPLRAGQDAALRDFKSAVPLCADESCTDRASLAPISGCYDYINVKLEKCGGLTEAIALIAKAQSQGWKIMVGCRVGTSLNLAPVTLTAQFAEFCDLDGPFLLAEDRMDGLSQKAGFVSLPDSALWG